MQMFSNEQQIKEQYEEEESPNTKLTDPMITDQDVLANNSSSAANLRASTYLITGGDASVIQVADSQEGITPDLKLVFSPPVNILSSEMVVETQA